MVKGFFKDLLEDLVIFGGSWLLPPFDHLSHLTEKSLNPVYPHEKYPSYNLHINAMI